MGRANPGPRVQTAREIPPYPSLATATSDAFAPLESSFLVFPPSLVIKRDWLVASRSGSRGEGNDREYGGGRSSRGKRGRHSSSREKKWHNRVACAPPCKKRHGSFFQDGSDRSGDTCRAAPYPVGLKLARPFPPCRRLVLRGRTSFGEETARSDNRDNGPSRLADKSLIALSFFLPLALVVFRRTLGRKLSPYRSCVSTARARRSNLTGASRSKMCACVRVSLSHTHTHIARMTRAYFADTPDYWVSLVASLSITRFLREL